MRVGGCGSIRRLGSYGEMDAISKEIEGSGFILFNKRVIQLEKRKMGC